MGNYKHLHLEEDQDQTAGSGTHSKRRVSKDLAHVGVIAGTSHQRRVLAPKVVRHHEKRASVGLQMVRCQGSGTLPSPWRQQHLPNQRNLNSNVSHEKIFGLIICRRAACRRSGQEVLGTQHKTRVWCTQVGVHYVSCDDAVMQATLPLRWPTGPSKQVLQG